MNMNMNMEVVDETIGSNDQVPIMKGRRTKRQRPSSPFSLASSSSVGAGSSGGGGGGSSSSPMNSGENTEEEEDMANCLILLAQGHNKKQHKRMDEESQKMVEATTIASKEDGLYVYQCKTCNRCFSSFQALGGHRASHKKPKAMEEKKAILMYEDNEGQFNNTSSTPCPNLSLLQHMGSTTTNNKSKVHECSICGAEFSSGQALGGHMRRHRTPTTTSMVMSHIATESQEKKGSRNNLLALDLNLPAPEEEHEMKFMFTSNQPLIFSPSSLVDCHY